MDNIQPREAEKNHIRSTDSNSFGNKTSAPQYSTEGSSLQRQLDNAIDRLKEQRTLMLGVAGVAGALLAGTLVAKRMQRRPTMSETVSSLLREANRSASTQARSARESTEQYANHAGEHLRHAADSIRGLSEEGYHKMRDTISERPVAASVGMLTTLLGTGAALYSVLSARRTPQTLEDMSYQQLYARARKLEISGRSGMSKQELIKAIKQQER